MMCEAERKEIKMQIIAHIESDFKEKFGIPRQSGLVEELEARIIFESEYRNTDAIRGLEEFSHLWLLWQFSENVRDTWSPTVRPPRLGGNERVGVFATRSPFRPNEIAMSVVRLLRVERDKEWGPVIYVGGADLMDGSPILDIKPYIPSVDSHPEAKAGFSAKNVDYKLEVRAKKRLEIIPQNKRNALIGVLAQDPRPAYQNDPERIYGMKFAGYEVKFRVDGKVLEIMGVEMNVL